MEGTKPRESTLHIADMNGFGETFPAPRLDSEPPPVPSFLLARQRAFGEFEMYAIVKTGGKQYQAVADDVIIIEKLEGDPGTKIELTEVMLVNDGKSVKIGSPFVKGAMVTGEIVRQAKGPKIEAFNYKAKKNERKRWGHRQPLTHLRITGIEAGK